MFLSDWRVLVRRWYIVLLGIQATVVLCYAATVFVPVKYQATADVLLLPPKATGKLAATQGDNPFLSLGGLDTVSGVLSKTLADRSTQLAVQHAGGTGSYTVVPDLTAGGPVLLVTALDSSPAAALKTLSAVSAVVPTTLTDLQTTSGVAASSLIRAKEITRDTVATPVRKSQMRAMLAAAAAGLGGTLLLTSLFDGFLARRSARRKAGKGGAGGEPVAEGAAPEPAGMPVGMPAMPNAAPGRMPVGMPAMPGAVPGGMPGGMPVPVEVRRPVAGEPVLWPPRGMETDPSGRPRLVPSVDPDATMEIHDLETAADLFTPATDARPVRPGRWPGLDWNNRRGSTG